MAKSNTQKIRRVKGLRTRYMINVLSVFAAAVVTLQIVGAVLIYNFYYGTVHDSIERELSFFCEMVDSYDPKTDSELETVAKMMVDDYVDKTRFEVQVFDRSGEMLVSSQGYMQTRRNMPDYDDARAADTGFGVWRGRLDSGETVMAQTMLVNSYDISGAQAVRFITSLERVDRSVLGSVLVILAAGIIMIGLVALSGRLFLRSIILPVRAITDTAFRIASGDFEARLPVDEKDGSEVAKLADTVNYMATELQNAQNTKNEFISSVSHELRTPLTAISGWGETVKTSIGTDNEITEKGIDIIIKETGRLTGLVEDLLDFSRLESGRLTLKFAPTDLLAELEEAVIMYKETAAKAGVTVEFRAPENLPPINADGDKLRQVFINIIDNAIKYCSPGEFVLVGAEAHDVYIEVTVLDTGCGIAPEDLGKVKEKFYKANTTVRGSGIGLAVADEIVKRHGGLLEIDSKLGEGTKVSINLPIINDNSEEENEDEQ